MSHLVLELRPGEMMVINGASLRFRSRCRVELVSKARFLFGKQLMAEPDNDSLLSLLYFHLQTAYVGDVADRANALSEAERLLAQAGREDALGETFCALNEAVSGRDFYKGLKLLRQCLLQEQAQTESMDPAL